MIGAAKLASLDAHGLFLPDGDQNGRAGAIRAPPATGDDTSTPVGEFVPRLCRFDSRKKFAHKSAAAFLALF